MKLIIGLGNPEPDYSWTRHNIGKETLNKFVESEGSGKWSVNKKLESEIVKVDGGILAKPLPYMNEAGRSIRKLVDYYNIELNDLLVIYDELDLVVGEYKMGKGKGSKIHNGILSVNQFLSGKNEDSSNDGIENNYWHLRVGVRDSSILGSVQKTGMDPAKYVLSQFGASDRENISKLLSESLVGELNRFLST